VKPGRIPLWLKVVYTGFVAVLVPYYWRTYGPVNFLWFCDIALLVTLAALWLESPLLFSMQAVLALVLLPICFFFLPPPPHSAANPTAAVNLNWVYGPGEDVMQTWMAPWKYLVLQMVIWTVVIYLPTHLALRRWAPAPMACAAANRLAEAPETV